MATTHDMRYEGQDSRRSVWSWIIALAIIALAAIALSSYLNRDNNTNGLNSGTGSTNSTLDSGTGVQSDLNTTPSAVQSQ